MLHHPAHRKRGRPSQQMELERYSGHTANDTALVVTQMLYRCSVLSCSVLTSSRSQHNRHLYSTDLSHRDHSSRS